jgi:O-acetyl-ADP-ribose deacetylase (regulator of RNase III)
VRSYANKYHHVAATTPGNDNKEYWRFAGHRNVNGAVHHAGGAELRAACRALPVLTPDEGGYLPNTRCAIGGAVATPSFGMLAETCDHVVHAVCPDGLYPPPADPSKAQVFSTGVNWWVDPRIDHGTTGNSKRHWTIDSPFGQPMLRKTFLAVFRTAATECRAEHVAVPALGCGVQGWRQAVAAHEAANAVEQAARERAADPDSLVVPSAVDFVVDSPDVWRTWRLVIEKALGKPLEEDRAKGEARWELPLGQQAGVS